MVRKVFFFFVVFFISASSVFASEVLTYQKIKNVTRGDAASGATTTIGLEGDRIHFLVYLKNTDTKQHTYTIKSDFPQFLQYIEQSAKYYRAFQGDWRNMKNNKTFSLVSHQETLDPDQWIYFTYRANISSLPQNNLIIANYIKIFDEENNLMDQSLTKILSPNQKLQNIPPKELTDYEKRVLEEEELFIEKAFEQQMQQINTDQNQNQNQNQNTNKALEETLSEESGFDYRWGVFTLSFLIFAFFLYKLTHKKL